MKPDITRKFNGIDYRFRMSLRASMDIETELKMPLTELKDNPSMAQINTIMHQTIRNSDGNKINDAEWGTIDDQISIADAAEIIKEVMGVSMPKSEGGDTKNE